MEDCTPDLIPVHTKSFVWKKLKFEIVWEKKSSVLGNVLLIAMKDFYTSQKMKFSKKDFFSKCDQIRRKLRIWSHLLKKSLMVNLIFSVMLKQLRNSDSLKKLNAIDVKKSSDTKSNSLNEKVFHVHFVREVEGYRTIIRWVSLQRGELKKDRKPYLYCSGASFQDKLWSLCH